MIKLNNVVYKYKILENKVKYASSQLCYVSNFVQS